MAAMADKASLVDMVKTVQRSSNEAKEAWWAYCDNFLGGIKDPGRHDAPSLSDFLSLYQQSGGIVSDVMGAISAGQSQSLGSTGGAESGWDARPPTGAAPQQAAGACGGASHGQGGGPAGGCGAPAAPNLQLWEVVKMGQSKCSLWKDAWQKYCVMYGTGYTDPSKYDDSYIQQFFAYVGELASFDLDQIAATGSSASSAKRSWSAGSDPAAKRMASGPAFDPEKALLVEQVKVVQKAGQETKELWWKYCDDYLGGMKDPGRHDARVLKEFLTTHGFL